MDESIYKSFGTINETFKLYKENTSYKDLPINPVVFDSQQLELENYTNLRDIMLEINEISRKLFVYGMIYESQNQVVQQLEDEFDMWQAKKYFEINAILPPLGKSEKRTEKEKENFIKVHFEKEYEQYSNLLRTETYKLGLVKRVVSGLENYGFKLHALKDYNIAAGKPS